MNQPRCLFWHRKDLRISDNIGLSIAAKNTFAITGVYILDEKIFPKNNDPPKLAPAQIWFLTRSLEELINNWVEIGSELIILHGDPVKLIPKLANAIRAEVVSWNSDIEPLNREIESKVHSSLSKQSIKVITSWDQLLVNPSTILTINGAPYKVFGAFWRNWKSKINQKSIKESPLNGGLNPIKSPFGLFKLDKKLQKHIYELFSCEIVTTPNKKLKEIRERNSFKGISKCPCLPGERQGNIQLQQFLESRNILNYSIYRDVPFNSRTSSISAGLKFGTISPRQAWLISLKAISHAKTKSEEESIYTWQKELCWREFYQNVLFNFPEIANGPYREKLKKFPWENNMSWLNSWKEGATGVPIVDASMRQLIETGWMHNRCRMIVASFLVKDLICNWQLGEQVFIDNLVDGDLASNNGGWQWSASSGMDTKPLRIFSPFTQAMKFDPNADFIRKWIPELSHVPTNDLLSGSITNVERRFYPEAIINHQVQQSKFKSIYKEL